MWHKHNLAKPFELKHGNPYFAQRTKHIYDLGTSYVHLRVQEHTRIGFKSYELWTMISVIPTNHYSIAIYDVAMAALYNISRHMELSYNETTLIYGLLYPITDKQLNSRRVLRSYMHWNLWYNHIHLKHTDAEVATFLSLKITPSFYVYHIITWAGFRHAKITRCRNTQNYRYLRHRIIFEVCFI